MRHSLLSALAILTLSAPAHAGFEWIPPADNPTAPVYVEPVTPTPPAPELIESIRTHHMAPPKPKAQLPDASLEEVTPVEAYVPAPITLEPMPAMAPAAPAPIVESAPVIQPSPITAEAEPPTPKPKDTLVINPTPMQQTSSAFTKNINGFGDDLPLALALSELVPPQFSYAFGNGVNPGVAVSWDGKGRPWPQVVSEMLQPTGMIASFRGSVLVISKARAGQAHTQYKGSMQQAPVAAHTITPVAVEAPAVEPTVIISNAPRRTKPAVQPFQDDGLQPMPEQPQGDQPVQLIPIM